ncbi:uncharacterized protein TEOVI_000139900 [Trypanosoma equiperdum]|uniref:Uncharacterized protein n=1 Tax=Trypanosoma equiperdum TaxID=5694 RepID=A0A1G4IC38_TRYEQ|nr:hypothetical protein, conserved [Trypanosoma equiperdum]
MPFLLEAFQAQSSLQPSLLGSHVAAYRSFCVTQPSFCLIKYDSFSTARHIQFSRTFCSGLVVDGNGHLYFSLRTAHLPSAHSRDRAVLATPKTIHTKLSFCGKSSPLCYTNTWQHPTHYA